MVQRALTNGALELDISKILNTPTPSPDTISYNVAINTPAKNVHIYDLVSVEVSRDYANNVCDYRLVTVTMPLGTYIRDVIEYLGELTMTIVTKYYTRSYTDTYDVAIVSGPGGGVASVYSGYSREELDNMDKVVVEFQCISRTAIAVRNIRTGGINANTTVSETIKGIMVNADYRVSENTDPETLRVNMCPADNDSVYSFINIPYDLSPFDIPTFLQNGEYGVYDYDIGVYLQKVGYFEEGDPVDTLFVYPLYNPNTPVPTGSKSLMIFNSPTAMLNKIESSYMIDGNIVKIIGGGDIRSTLPVGAIADMKGPVEYTTSSKGVIDENKERIDAPKTNTNPTTPEKGKSIGTGAGDTRANTQRHDDNISKLMSNRSRDALDAYQITWNYSNPELLYPGMPVTYVYTDAVKGVIRLSGVVHSTFSRYVQANKTHVTVLNVLLEQRYSYNKVNSNDADVRY